MTQTMQGTGAAHPIVIPLVKVDVERRLVIGLAAEERGDKTKEIMDYESAKPAFQAWSEGYSASTGGLSKGNLRAMHGKTVAGRFDDITFNDQTKQVHVCAKVLDDNEWEKVLGGCYTGFSIGGGYMKKWQDPNDPALTRYTPIIREISLVDNPCLDTARFAELVKADGLVEQLELRGTARTFGDMYQAPAPTFGALVKVADEAEAARPRTFGEMQKNWQDYAAVAGGAALGGVALYGLHRLGQANEQAMREEKALQQRKIHALVGVDMAVHRVNSSEHLQHIDAMEGTHALQRAAREWHGYVEGHHDITTAHEKAQGHITKMLDEVKHRVLSDKEHAQRVEAGKHSHDHMGKVFTEVGAELAKEFDESKHSRGEDGRWSAGGRFAAGVGGGLLGNYVGGAVGSIAGGLAGRVVGGGHPLASALGSSGGSLIGGVYGAYKGWKVATGLVDDKNAALDAEAEKKKRKKDALDGKTTSEEDEEIVRGKSGGGMGKAFGLLKRYDKSKHPREHDGQFASKTGETVGRTVGGVAGGIGGALLGHKFGATAGGSIGAAVAQGASNLKHLGGSAADRAFHGGFARVAGRKVGTSIGHTFGSTIAGTALAVGGSLAGSYLGSKVDEAGRVSRAEKAGKLDQYHRLNADTSVKPNTMKQVRRTASKATTSINKVRAAHAFVTETMGKAFDETKRKRKGNGQFGSDNDVAGAVGQLSGMAAGGVAGHYAGKALGEHMGARAASAAKMLMGRKGKKGFNQVGGGFTQARHVARQIGLHGTIGSHVGALGGALALGAAGNWAGRKLAGGWDK